MAMMMEVMSSWKKRPAWPKRMRKGSVMKKE